VLFSEYMRDALYGPAGFYTSGMGAPGRRGDFITSPDVGPLFGAVIAHALDSWWDELGRPERFDVIEGGAGSGALRKAVLSAAPRCGGALRYRVVEIGPYAPADALVDLPTEPIVGVVLANELLDNLPVDLRAGDRLLTTEDMWADVGVTPVQIEARRWVERAIGIVERGRVVAIDYCGTGFADRPWAEWLRTYQGHQRGGHPLDAPGTQDITCEIDIAQLPVPARNRSQAGFLLAHGIEALVDEGRRIWHERAHIGDLAAIRARSRVGEAEALCDPAGLGAFRVLEWDVGSGGGVTT
jgi:SAM-dependent MidA family methyltransferase